MALIETKRLDTKHPNVLVANKAKGLLIGLYAAKRHLLSLVELEQQQTNIFKKAG